MNDSHDAGAAPREHGIKRLVVLSVAGLTLAGLVLGASLAGAGQSKSVASAAVVGPKVIANGSTNSLEVYLIPGDGTHKSPTGMDVLSWSWGESRASSPVGASAGLGKVSFSSFNIMKYADKASPLLALACATGQAIKTVTFTIDPPAGVAGDSLTIVMSNARVTSSQVSGGGGERPVESLSFNFSKITYDYKTQSTGKVTHFGWDLATQKKV